MSVSRPPKSLRREKAVEREYRVVPTPEGWANKEDQTRECLTDSKHILLTRAQLESLPEYSASLPTGQYTGKRWRRRYRDADGSLAWQVGEYGCAYEDPRGPRFGECIQIIWRDTLWNE